MTTRPWFRSAALFLLIPMLAVVIAYDLAWWFSDASGHGGSYLMSVIAQAQPALSLGYVFVAASGAASGLAFRRSGLSSHPSSRSRARIVLAHLAPSLCLGLICWIACVLVSVTYASTVRLSLEPLPLVGVQLLGVASWALTGFALGYSRLGTAGLAVVPVLCFFVFGFFENLPLRFGSAVNGGDFSYCCGPSETISRGSLIATGSFFAVLLLLSGALLSGPRTAGSRARAPASAGAGVAAVVSLVVGTLTPFPAIAPRPGNPPCTQVDGSSICLWPEQTQGHPSAPVDIAELASVLRAHGVDIPSRISGDLADAEALNYPRTPTSKDGAKTLLVSALTSTGSSCGTFDENATPALMSYYNVLSAWLYRAGGLDAAPITGALSSAESQGLRALLSSPHNDQSEWVNSYIAALHSCATAAPDLPRGGQ